MFPHVPQDPRWRNFSRMRRRVSSGKRSRGCFFRGTERLFFIKRHAISSWKYIQSIAKVSYKEILREKFHEILFFDLFFFFSESVEYDWIWFWRIGYFFRRIYFLRRISHLNWLLTISMRSEKKKKKMTKCEEKTVYTIRKTRVEKLIRIRSLNIVNIVRILLLTHLNTTCFIFNFTIPWIKRRGDFLPVNQFLILKSLELHERIKSCIKML